MYGNSVSGLRSTFKQTWCKYFQDFESIFPKILRFTDFGLKFQNNNNLKKSCF